MSHTRTCPNKNWKLLQNVCRATSAFTTSLPREINLEDLIEDLNYYTLASPIRSSSNISKAIETYRIRCRLFECIERSNKRDLEEISWILENSPDKYIREENDPESFVNKPNSLGIRPLYEAAKHGYFKTVLLLIDFGALPNLECNGETSLAVSSRWGHTEVVKCLLKNYKWTNRDKRRAWKVAEKSTKGLLKVKNRCVLCW